MEGHNTVQNLYEQAVQKLFTTQTPDVKVTFNSRPVKYEVLDERPCMFRLRL